MVAQPPFLRQRGYRTHAPNLVRIPMARGQIGPECATCHRPARCPEISTTESAGLIPTDQRACHVSGRPVPGAGRARSVARMSLLDSTVQCRTTMRRADLIEPAGDACIVGKW